MTAFSSDRCRDLRRNRALRGACDPDGRPAPFRRQDSRAAGSRRAVIVADIARTPAGTIGFGGPMAPRHAFPPGAEQSFATYFRIGDDGTVDTGYPCSADPQTRCARGDGAAGRLGQCRRLSLRMRDLQDVVGMTDDRHSCRRLSRRFAGHRLAGASRRSARRCAGRCAAIRRSTRWSRAFRDRRRRPRRALA